MPGFDPWAVLREIEASGSGDAPARSLSSLSNFSNLSSRTPGNAKISPSAWDASDWREYHEERVAVAVIDGEQPEPDARRIAWECCLTRWRELNPVASDPGRCAHCGRPDEPGNIVPFGIGPHTWLHDRCWPAWDRARQAEAEAVLRALLGGIENE